LLNGITLGVEEEFFVSPKYKIEASAAQPIIEHILADLKGYLEERAEKELFLYQIELKTGICHSFDEVRRDIFDYRLKLKQVLDKFDCVTFACGTHPFIDWRDVPRKQALRTLAYKTAIADGMASCGMHTHIGVEDPVSRFALYNFLRGYLPLFLALSASSAFWNGKWTKLLAFRPSIIARLPRGGVPPPFQHLEFQDYLGALDSVEEKWELVQGHWFLRPHRKFPTIEVRIMDMCPDVGDALAIIALIACLSASFLANPERWTGASASVADEILILSDEPRQHLLAESIWIVQRKGLRASILAQRKGQIKQARILDVLATLVDELKPVAAELNCLESLLHLKTLETRGTSSDRQLAAYRDEIAATGESTLALRRVALGVLRDFGYQDDPDIAL
jgi:carboxylate-amine ligase